MKVCTKCKVAKPLTEYNRHSQTPSGLQPACKACNKIACAKYYAGNKEKVMASNAKWVAKNKEKVVDAAKFWRIKNYYGLSREAYKALLAKQGGKCAICRKVPERFCVDHNHETKITRGLLCVPCNVGLGNFFEAAPSLLSAVDYLIEHGAPAFVERIA